MAKWIDLHAHLNFLEITPKEAIENALANNVERIITIGTCEKDLEQVRQIAEEFAPQVFFTQGVHPHDAKDYNETTEAIILKNLSHERCVAVGEIGLDYYYDNSPREVQQEVFRRQLQIAHEQALPVQIHTRDAEADTVEILKEFGANIRGVIHCFTSSQWLAEKCLDLGLNISFSGVVSFKNADELRKVVQYVPLNRLHVETDSPFLAPVPMRGKKNQPAYVVHTAECVANLKGIGLEELSEQTNKNAHQVFTKLF